MVTTWGVAGDAARHPVVQQTAPQQRSPSPKCQRCGGSGTFSTTASGRVLVCASCCLQMNSIQKLKSNVFSKGRSWEVAVPWVGSDAVVGGVAVTSRGREQDTRVCASLLCDLEQTAKPLYLSVSSFGKQGQSRGLPHGGDGDK